MSAARKLLEQVADLGGRVYLGDAGKLKVEARAPLPERVVVVDLRQHKEEVIAELRRAEARKTEAAVASLLDAMAAENTARRDWFRVSPYEPDGSLVVRSALTGEEITINLPYRGTRH
jgi:hypothetical protein